MIRNFFSVLLILFLTPFIVSCESDSDLYKVGDNWTDSYLNAYRIDTLTVKTSTIMLDSISTSGNSGILVGYNNDPYFGKVTAKSFMALSPQSYSITKNSDNQAPIFDSISLLLTYDGYYYGDTLQTTTINVHKLTQKLKLDDETSLLYNTSTFNYDSNTLGSLTFHPRPKTAGSKYVRIPLNYNFGLNLFNTLRNEDIPDQESFLSYLQGIVLTSNTSSNSIIRYKINESGDGISLNSGEVIKPNLRIYYHYPPDTGDEPTTRYFNFTITQSTQFNNLKSDFTGSALEGLTPDHPLPSTATGNRSFMQCGLGIMTKVEVPYLKNLNNIGQNVEIVDAQLYMRPVENSFLYPYYLPSTLKLYKGNTNNEITSTFTDASGSEISVSRYTDPQFQEDNYYMVSLSYYLQNQLTATDFGLYSLLMLPNKYTTQSLDRIVFTNSKYNQDNKMELKVYILKY